MVRNKTHKVVAPKVVWRMSPAHPRGEFVQVSARGLRDTAASEAHERGFAVSSLDLLCGADVSEAALDALPSELIEALSPMAAPAHADAEPGPSPGIP